eukprot:3704321-Amphidinium_carterae.1
MGMCSRGIPSFLHAGNIEFAEFLASCYKLRLELLTQAVSLELWCVHRPNLCTPVLEPPPQQPCDMVRSCGTTTAREASAERDSAGPTRTLGDTVEAKLKHALPICVTLQ